MSIYSASVYYSLDGGKSYKLYDDNYPSSSENITAEEYNKIVTNEILPASGSKSALFKVFRTGSVQLISGSLFTTSSLDAREFYGGGTKIQFSSYYSVYEHKYMCVVKRGEFNRSLNVSLHDISGSQLVLPITEYDTAGSASIFNMDENFTPYVTTIGLYDDSEQLVAYAKFANPIKITKDFDSVFIIKFDV